VKSDGLGFGMGDPVGLPVMSCSATIVIPELLDVALGFVTVSHLPDGMNKDCSGISMTELQFVLVTSHGFTRCKTHFVFADNLLSSKSILCRSTQV
jgi:hypothetical protein